jgi:hypothetical protein
MNTFLSTEKNSFSGPHHAQEPKPFLEVELFYSEQHFRLCQTQSLLEVCNAMKADFQNNNVSF